MPVAHARHLGERFCPDTGAPLRVGMVWPPRLMVHDVCRKGTEALNEAIASVYVRHDLKKAVEVIIRPGNAPAHDPNGQPVPGLSVGRSARTVQGGPWGLTPVSLQWTPELQRRLGSVAWVRKELVIELKSPETTRSFQWYVYLTADGPTLPRHASLYDDHPHYRWVTEHGGPILTDGVSTNWVELPAPMSSPALTPACWIQERRKAAGPPGPDTLEITPVFPLEPAVTLGLEVAGWNGALGGHDRRPMLLPLGLRSAEDRDGQWSASLEYWDTTLEGSSPHHLRTRSVLEAPTPCVWPRVLSAETRPIEMHQLREPTETGCEVLLNVQFQLPDDAEPIRVTHADVMLGNEKVGHWFGPQELYAGREWSLPIVVDQDRLARRGQERLKLTLAFHGETTRGVCAMRQVFRTENGPYVHVRRARYEGKSRRPWLVIDLGTEGTCAAVAFFDGFAPRVLTIPFAEGPIHPSRVYVAPGQGGSWSLTDQPSDDALYTTGIKLGLRFGDGAHPGCPDHVSALEVARFYLRRFLLELKERAAWFPLESCDVLVSFPPRLVCMPRFVGSLREAFRDVIPEVLWPSGRQGRIRFREEAFLVAMPTLYRDMQLQPLAPGRSRFYWVMDFGGGTTDICGFSCTADAYGEEQTIADFTYPQRFPHHLSGNDITTAFYTTLRRYLMLAGVVAGSPTAVKGRQFVFPEDPFPSTRATHAALLNQTALRELADLLKCTPVAAQDTLTVRDLAKSLRSTMLQSVDVVATTLVALLGDEAKELGLRTVGRLHADVIDPSAAMVRSVPVDTHTARPATPSETAPVACGNCAVEHQLPLWVFSSHRPFRFRCSACGTQQTVEGRGARSRVEGEASVPQGLPEQSNPSLLLKQEHQNYRVPGWEALRRWVGERRVGPDDKVSDNGVVWERLRDRPELADLFEERASPEVHWNDPTTEKGAGVRQAVPWAGEDPGLGVRIEQFVEACQAALAEALSRIGSKPDEVVVLLAGRASMFQPIAEGIHRVMSGRVVHLTNAWVRAHYGDTGTIDPGAGLKTLTVNGGGLFALNQTHADTSHLLLRFETQRVDCHTYLDTGERMPYWLTRQLDLRPGSSVPLVRSPPEGSPAEALPDGHPLLGEVRLLIEGLPEDQAWEPWVTVGRGTVRRRDDGHRPRLTEATALLTGEGEFVLSGLSSGASLHLENLLPPLELLGDNP